MRERTAALVLEDGRAFVGEALGAPVLGQGEVVFNTAMTGYQEVLTDPSYAGQMVCMTYPLQGNYGITTCHAESSRPWSRALIARWACGIPSHHGALESLDAYLWRHELSGIHDIDTRALTRHLRTHGALRAVLSHEEGMPSGARLAELAELARAVLPLSDQDLVAQVSRNQAEEWLEPLADELRPPCMAEGRGMTIAVVDYGVKRNILRSLRSRGCRVVVLPHTAGWADVLEVGADGLVLSNGPGDPAVLKAPVELCREALRQRIPIFGICLGHQILGMAIGGETARLPFGHHGANHPVRQLETARVSVTSQNHEFQVLAGSLPGGGEDDDFAVTHVNLNDGSVEGLASRSLPAFSVQYHPEGAPGPQDSQHLFDEFIEMIVSGRPRLRAMTGGRRPARPGRVLILGSGPIVIGQAAEFDYAGTQACKALREEGVETVLVNSNPATIMTDEDVADRVYIEPLTIESLRAIIARERPDALLPTLGGQTGLNLAMELHHAGVLAEFGVDLLGAGANTIRLAEDREAFKQLLLEIDEPVPPSRVCQSLEEARAFVVEIGLPVVVRPGYTLGGTGGGFVTTPEDLDQVVRGGLAASPIGQVLVERSLWGWKELEYEVMRDAADTCITVCNMENLDPMGVHTGDSIVVAPAQTLTDREHQMLRSSALRIIRALGIEGGCNIQFALDPHSSAYYVIEVNPRVSRSSALASKATGYPIAQVAAKVAIGRQLDEIRNEVTGRTFAAFEPALDYVVVKVPRWPFDKFPGADRRLGTQMKSTGEVMAIERTFEGALVKAMRSLEQLPPEETELEDPALIDVPNDRRLFALLQALRRGDSPAGLGRRTGIDVWFLERLQHIVQVELGLATAAAPDPDIVRRARRSGFSNAMIEALAGWRAPAAWPTYKLVDTCAAEFDAATPYYYSAWEEEDEADGAPPGARLVLGSGPIRIGQGIEFDYCSVHAAWAFRQAGARAVLVNSNPETVSTDYDTADRLYFEPLDADSVLHVARSEAASDACVQVGGQTAINLAGPVESSGLRAMGTPVDAIDAAEDRRRFAALLESLRIPRPPGETTASLEEAYLIADRIGYPVLVRPSYVLGGRAMQIVPDPGQLRRYMEWAVSALPRGTVLIDKYLEGMELEVDAVADGETVIIPGIMEHVERAGVHSGDSMAVYPPPSLEPAESAVVVAHTIAITRALGVVGLVNIQFILHRGRIYVLEVNPRASRTAPFISKVTGVPLVRLACQASLGHRLQDLGWRTGLVPAPPLVAVKAPVFSTSKLVGVDPYLGPEMQSTGEVMGVARDLPAALCKAFIAAGVPLPREGAALLSVAGEDLRRVVPVGAGLARLGCHLMATPATAVALEVAGLEVQAQSDAEALAAVTNGEVELVIATEAGTFPAEGTAAQVRRAAAERRLPCLSSLDTARALVEAAEAAERALEVMRLDEWRRPAHEPTGTPGHAASAAAGTPISGGWPPP